ncbi:MAG: glycosyltransferase [Jatrophihabitantaceae bacterium]
MATVARCSVVIPTYNRAELLRRTLDSLAWQDLPRTAFEVLVVDDGSSDGTAGLIEGYRDRLDLRYFFQPDEGWRVAQARNVGIAHATGEVCVFVDSGVLLHSGCLRAHAHSHQQASGPVAVSGYVFGFDNNGSDADPMTQALDFDDLDATIELIRDTGQWPDIREPFYARHAYDLHRLPAPWVLYWTCNVSAPTDRVRSVGGFDEHFRSWGGEDIDLGYRLHSDGVRFVLNRSASSIHYPHAKSSVVNFAQARDNYRYMARKYDTPITRLVSRLGGAMNAFTLNDAITIHGLPSCAEYLRQQAAVPGAELPAAAMSARGPGPGQ